MSDSDTVKLLRECNSGIQMAVFSIDEILEKVTDKNLYEILKKSKEKHEKLGDETHAILAECGDETKEPNMLAKGMSWMKTGELRLPDTSSGGRDPRLGRDRKRLRHFQRHADARHCGRR